MVNGIFGLAASHVDWLLAKNRVIGENIVNANAPGYKAREVTPFEQIVSSSFGGLQSTHPLHISADPGSVATSNRSLPGGEVSLTGNSVQLERELADMASVRAAYGLDTGVIKAFHRMYLLSVRTAS